MNSQDTYRDIHLLNIKIYVMRSPKYILQLRIMISKDTQILSLTIFYFSVKFSTAGHFCIAILFHQYFLQKYQNEISRTGASTACFLQIIAVPLY